MFLVKPHMDALSDPTLNIQLFLKKDLHILGIPSHWLLWGQVCSWGSACACFDLLLDLLGTPQLRFSTAEHIASAYSGEYFDIPNYDCP